VRREDEIMPDLVELAHEEDEIASDLFELANKKKSTVERGEIRRLGTSGQ
jgi:hypothetical protein